MKTFLCVLAAALLAGCNPAPRCTRTSDCATGLCSGGFCTDFDAGASNDGGSTEQAVDRDDPDAAVVDSGLPVDAGVLDNGRG